MAYIWEHSEYERLSPLTQDARVLLERWFRAIEDGSVNRYRPDPRYVVVIEQSACDAIIDRIELEFARELRAWASQKTAGSYDSGPGFDRLTPPQRLALAQQLHSLKRKHKRTNSDPAYAPYGWYPPQVAREQAVMPSPPEWLVNAD